MSLHTRHNSRYYSRYRASDPLAVLLIVVSLLAAPGCRYEKVITRTSILSGLDGSESMAPPKRATQTLPDFLRTPDEGIRIENDDGSITLYAKSVRQLMAHITTTIANGERDLFVEQVLSTLTKEEFYDRGLDPAIAFDELSDRQKEIGRLFYFMPMGEYTPGLFLETVGRNVFRLKVPRAGHQSLYWVGLDVVFEKGNYRLRWFLD